MAWVRRALVAVLGVVVMVDSLAGDQFRVLEFIVGLVMVGLVPVDALIDAISRPKQDDAQLDRLAEVMRDHDEPPS